MTAAAVSRVQYRPKLLLFVAAIVVLVLLALLPPYIGLYQTQLLTYGLIAAIAALGSTSTTAAAANSSSLGRYWTRLTAAAVITRFRIDR